MKPAPGMNLAISLGIAVLTIVSTTKSMIRSITMSLRSVELLLDLLPGRRRALGDERHDDVEAGLQRLDAGSPMTFTSLPRMFAQVRPSTLEDELDDLAQRERLSGCRRRAASVPVSHSIRRP